MGRPKLDYIYVKNEIEMGGSELLSEVYKNNKIKLKIRCPVGHVYYVNYNNWKTGYRCPYCSNQLVCKDNNLFVRYPEVAKEWNYIRNNGLLPEDILPGSHKKVWWVCDEGHGWVAIPNNRTSNVTGCPNCAGKAVPTIEFIRLDFEKYGYFLKTLVYIDCYQKLEYICPCGHEHSITWSHWQQGQRCPICANINKFGPGNPNWRGGAKAGPYCIVWECNEYKEYIKERDGNKCMNPCCSGKYKQLSIHHIDYNKKSCGLENLITLCISCNSRANKDRDWHTAWYRAIMYMRYGYIYDEEVY